MTLAHLVGFEWSSLLRTLRLARLGHIFTSVVGSMAFLGTPTSGCDAASRLAVGYVEGMRESCLLGHPRLLVGRIDPQTGNGIQSWPLPSALAVAFIPCAAARSSRLTRW